MHGAERRQYMRKREIQHTTADNQPAAAPHTGNVLLAHAFAHLMIHKYLHVLHSILYLIIELLGFMTIFDLRTTLPGVRGSVPIGSVWFWLGSRVAARGFFLPCLLPCITLTHFYYTRVELRINKHHKATYRTSRKRQRLAKAKTKTKKAKKR